MELRECCRARCFACHAAGGQRASCRWLALAGLLVKGTAQSHAHQVHQRSHPATPLQIEFVDNQDVLDLIEARMGILDLLDESCRFPKVGGAGAAATSWQGQVDRVACRPAPSPVGQDSLPVGRSHAELLALASSALPTFPALLSSCRQATHEDFANKLYGAPSVSDSKRFSKPKLSRTDFTIDHYAGAWQAAAAWAMVLVGSQATPAAFRWQRAAVPCLLHSRLDMARLFCTVPAGAVTYRTDNFLAKNRDFVVAEHQALLGASDQDFVRQLFPPDADGPADGGALQLGEACGGT